MSTSIFPNLSVPCATTRFTCSCSLRSASSGEYLGTHLFAFVRDLLQILFALPGDEHEIGSFARERKRNRFAVIASRPGNERDLPFQLSHVSSLSCLPRKL